MPNPNYKMIFHFQGRFKETFIKEGAATVEETKANLVRILQGVDFITFDSNHRTYNKTALIAFDVLPIREDVKEDDRSINRKISSDNLQ